MDDKGIKYDTGKLEFSLLPWSAVEHVVRVLMFGAQKYGSDNWKMVEDGEKRYWDAAARHLVAYAQGEVLDEESNLPHLAHAACCLLFLLWLGKGEGDVYDASVEEMLKQLSTLTCTQSYSK